MNLGVLENEIRFVEEMKENHMFLLIILGILILPYTIIYLVKSELHKRTFGTDTKVENISFNH